ncbi:MAG: hypothetical protein VKP63_01965 [Cyanobacteriota bacterium]|nr:hypothetical protein [Cyanobacteriota bacterium]
MGGRLATVGGVFAGVVAVVPMLWGVDAAALSAPAPLAASIAAAEGLATAKPLGEALKPSTAQQQALADHLRRQGAVFYGAWWCPACFKQKNLFGQQAGNSLPYVECEKTEDQRKRCQNQGIAAYPTWVLGNQRLEGVQTLDRLSQWSGFNP